MRIVLLLVQLTWVITSMGQWVQTNGPYGGLMRAPVQVGDDLFVGTWGGGVLRSTDNGVQWEAANHGLGNLADLSVARVSSIDGTLYVGTDGGMYRSFDQGGNWTRLAEGWADGTTTSILVEGQHVFIGTWGSGIVRSLNGGATWGWANTGLPGSAGIGQVMRCGPYLFCDGWNGVFRSADDGGTWTLVNTPTEQPSIAVIGTVLYAVDHYTTAYRSMDHGDTWELANVGLGSHVTSFISVGGDLYAGTASGGIYRTMDGGDQWSLLGSLDEEIFSISVVGSTTYASTWSYGVGDLYRSTNDGVTWSMATNDMTATQVHSMAIGHDVLHAGTKGNGFFTSLDGGEAWSSSSTGLPQPMEIRCIAVNGTDLLAGGDMGAYASGNSGANWTYGSTGLTNSSMSRMVRIGNSVFAATASGVFITTNNGSNWTPVNNGLGANPYIMDVFAQSDTLYACGNTGVFTSTNHGNSWASLNGGLPSTTFRSIVKNNGVLLTHTINQIYRSVDNGVNWTNHTLPAIQCMISTGNTVVIGRRISDTGSDVVQRSDDQGITWTSMTDDIGNPQILSLATDGTMLYAGTRGSGVWKRPLNDIHTHVPGPTEDTPIFIRFDQAAGNLLVDLGDENRQSADLAVCDASGRIVLSTRIAAGTTMVPVGELVRGVYIASVHMGDHRLAKRFVVAY